MVTFYKVSDVIVMMLMSSRHMCWRSVDPGLRLKLFLNAWLIHPQFYVFSVDG